MVKTLTHSIHKKKKIKYIRKNNMGRTKHVCIMMENALDMELMTKCLIN